MFPHTTKCILWSINLSLVLTCQYIQSVSSSHWYDNPLTHRYGNPYLTMSITCYTDSMDDYVFQLITPCHAWHSMIGYFCSVHFLPYMEGICLTRDTVEVTCISACMSLCNSLQIYCTLMAFSCHGCLSNEYPTSQPI